VRKKNGKEEKGKRKRGTEKGEGIRVRGRLIFA